MITGAARAVAARSEFQRFQCLIPLLLQARLHFSKFAFILTRMVGHLKSDMLAVCRSRGLC